MLSRLASPRTAGLAAFALVVLLLPLALRNNYYYEVAILVGLNAIVCVGLNLLIGYAGCKEFIVDALFEHDPPQTFLDNLRDFVGYCVGAGLAESLLFILRTRGPS